MSSGTQGLIKSGAPGLIPPIEGVIDAFYKEGDHYRFIGKTSGDFSISVDVEPGTMVADVGGLLMQVKGEHTEVSEGSFTVYDDRDRIFGELDIEPDSRFRLEFCCER
jgi:hypothetical protein